MLLAALMFCPAAIRAADVSSADLAQRAKDVEAMSLIDRDRLIRNWDAFQKMPPERQQHFRQLHQQLQNDVKEGSSLNHTMQTYSQWLQTLTPGQREDLRQAKNSRDKLDLVRKFKEDQDERLEGRGKDRRDDHPSDPRRFFRNFFRAKPLTPVELDAALKGLVENLPNAERAEIANLENEPKWARYRRIIQSSVRQAGGPKEWPNKDQQGMILAAIKATKQAQEIDAIKDDRTRRSRVAMLLFSSFAAQMFAESAAFQPKEDDLKQMYEQLKNAEREELLQLKLHEMNLELRRRYTQKQFEERPDFRELSRVHREFHDYTRQLLMDSDLGGGRFGRPGGGFGPGRPPRGPDGDNPPPDRGPGDRGPGDRGRPRPPRD